MLRHKTKPIVESIQQSYNTSLDMLDRIIDPLNSLGSESLSDIPIDKYIHRYKR